jgi:hypothetical protein
MRILQTLIFSVFSTALMDKEQVLRLVANAYDYALKAMLDLDEKTLSK